VIALQEVSKPFETQLRKQGWVQAEWVLATSLDEYWRVAGKDGQGKGKKEAKREGVLIMVKRELWTKESEVGIVKLKRANNEQAKALVVVRIVREGTEIVSFNQVANSAIPELSSPIRSANARHITSYESQRHTSLPSPRTLAFASLSIPSL